MAIYQEEVNQIYPVQDFINEELKGNNEIAREMQNIAFKNDEERSAFVISKYLEKFLEKNDEKNQLISEARLEGFKKYFSKYNERVKTLQHNVEQEGRNEETNEFLEELKEENKEAREALEAKIEEELEKALDKEEIQELPETVIIIGIYRIYQEAAHRLVNDKIRKATQAEYKKHSQLSDLDLTELEEARIRGYNNANVTSSKPQFAIEKMESREWETSINDTYLQYRILSAKDSNYILRESVRKHLRHPEQSWLEQIDVDKLDVNEKTELRQGMIETEKDLARQDAQMAKEAIQNNQDEFNKEVDIVTAEYEEKGYVIDQLQTAELVPPKPENINDLNEQATANETNTATNDVSVEETVVPTAEGTHVEPGTATNATVVEGSIAPMAEATVVASVDQPTPVEKSNDPTGVADLPEQTQNAPKPKPSPSSSEKSDTLKTEPAKPTLQPMNNNEYNSFLDTHFASRLEPAPNTGKKAEKDETLTTSTSAPSLTPKPPSATQPNGT